MYVHSSKQKVFQNLQTVKFENKMFKFPSTVTVMGMTKQWIL